jgi:hypothetical protein
MFAHGMHDVAVRWPHVRVAVITFRDGDAIGVQGQHWACLLRYLQTMHTLVAVGHNCIFQPLELLSRIEDASYIHCRLDSSRCSAAAASPHASSVQKEHAPRGCIVVDLVRYGLSFQLQPGDTRLHSMQYAGFSVLQDGTSGAGNVRLPLPERFHAFLLLQSTGAEGHVKVLLPAGPVTVDKAGRVEVSDPAAHARQRMLHVYDFHAQSQMLFAQTKAARLFLAALYAAGSSALHVPCCGATGAEAALQPLRSSWGNQPFNTLEQESWDTLAQHAAGHPALQLLTAAVASDAGALQAMHAIHSGLPTEQVTWPAVAEAEYMAEVVQLQPLPFRNVRRELNGDERSCLLTTETDPTAVPLINVQAVLTSNDLIALCSGTQPDFVGRKGPGIHAVLADSLADLAARFQACDSDAAAHAPGGHEGLLQELGLDPAQHGQGALARGFIQGLNHSAAAYAATPLRAAIDPAALDDLASGLHQLQRTAEDAAEGLKDWLLCALAHTPSTPHGLAFAALRCGGLVAMPCAADLLALSLDDGRLLVRCCCHVLELRPPCCLQLPQHHSQPIGIVLATYCY